MSRLTTWQFPQKSTPSKLDDAFLEERRCALDAYLTSVMGISGIANVGHGRLQSEELGLFLDFENRGKYMASPDAAPRENYCVLISAILAIQTVIAGYNILVGDIRPQSRPIDTALSFGAMQIALYFPIILVFAWAVDGIARPAGSDLPVLAMLGFTRVLVGQLLFILGTFYSSPVVASIMMCNREVWTAWASRFFRAATDGSAQVGSMWTFVSRLSGVMCATFGSLIMVAFSPSNYFAGCVLLVFSCLAMTTGDLIDFRYIRTGTNYARCSVLAWSQGFAAVFATLALMYFRINPNARVSALNLDGTGTAALVYTVVVWSLLRFCMTQWLKHRLSEYALTAFLPIQILITVIMSYVHLGAQLGMHEATGAALVICGLLIVSLATHQEDTAIAANYNAVDTELGLIKNANQSYGS
jgi:drug/metabolite transporter (DMT)-like permease